MLKKEYRRQCNECGGKIVTPSHGANEVCEDCGLCFEQIIYGTLQKPFKYISMEEQVETIKEIHEREEGPILRGAKFPYTFILSQEDFQNMSINQQRKYKKWRDYSLDRRAQRIFIAVDEYIELLNLSLEQKMNLKKYANQLINNQDNKGKFKVENSVDVIEEIIKYIIQFKLLSSYRILYQNILRCDFTDIRRVSELTRKRIYKKLIKKIQYPRRKYIKK